MNTLKKIVLISIFTTISPVLYCQNSINIFSMITDNLKTIGFMDEFESGDFKGIWGQTLDELADEIARLNLLFFENADDKARSEQIRGYLGDITIPALENVYRPEINAISVIDHEQGTNRITVCGGYIILAYFISCCYSYDQYCQIYKTDNVLEYENFLSALGRIIKQNWVCGRNSAEYRELASFVKTYSALENTSNRDKNAGKALYSLEDYFSVNFQTLILYIYSHEISHLVFKHDPQNKKRALIENEREADSSAAVFLFTRVKGGWGVETEQGKTKATIEPVLRLLEFTTRLYPDSMEDRLVHFMRSYLWAETIFNNSEGK